MTDIYLHHYPMSPFAEKVRLMLGFKQLTWHSVMVPSVSPKPDVVALTGGYRKTPFLQLGNDVFCDTALIADVLEHLAPTPSLYPQGNRGLNRVVAQWADQQLFWAAMAYNFQPAGMQQLFDGAPADAIKAFGADRGAMSAGMTRVRPADGTSAYKSYLRRLNDMLHEQGSGGQGDAPFLLGTGAPSLADFAAYHAVWFTQHQVPALAGILDATPGVKDWLARMTAFGHGKMVRSKASEAIAASAHASSAGDRNDIKLFGENELFQNDHGIPLGAAVTVAAESFGTEVTEGILMAATRTRYTLQHTNERAGTVRVHFPRVGYVLKAAEGGSLNRVSPAAVTMTLSTPIPTPVAAQSPADKPVAVDVSWRCLPFAGLGVAELYAVLQLRSAVFVVEQACVFQDMDGLDPVCHHLLGQDARGGLLAYARLVPAGVAFAEASVGRVITAPAARGTALGHRLMAQACTQLAQLWGAQPIRIGAQAHLQAFYGRHGFVAEGAGYIEDGIPHVEMLRPAQLQRDIP